MKVAFSPIYRYKLPEGHRFPMEKYTLLPEQLLFEGTVEESDFFEPQSCTDEILLWTHSREYLDQLQRLDLTRREEKKIGFPVRSDLISRGRVIAHGTIECALHALNGEVALNIAGGTHHAFRGHGEGFCIFNDFAIAANYLLQHKLVKKVVIVDLDVHQGNGTASIFRHDPRVFTFSMHGHKNYPILKEKSDLDIPLANGTQDEEYLHVLQSNLPRVLESARPDLVFYLSGVDVLSTDKLGKLALSIQGTYERDLFVYETCAKLGIPVATSMGGGYSEHIRDIIKAHANTYCAAKKVFE